MSKCVFCGRTEEELDGAKMEVVYPNDIHRNYLFKDVNLPFVFYYEQDEGKRYDGPGVSFYPVDACHECLIRGSGFQGYGVMGINRYSICRNTITDEEIKQKAEEYSRELIAFKERQVSSLSERVDFARKHPFKNLLLSFMPWKENE